MGYSQAYTAYQKTNVSTASQGRLIVLLYEGAVKNLKAAAGLFEQDDTIKARNIEQYAKYVQKAQAIITELQVSLDMEKGGEIAKNLMALYLYFNRELTDAIVHRDKKKTDSVLNMMQELLDAWRQASNSIANAPAAVLQSAVNIEG